MGKEREASEKLTGRAVSSRFFSFLFMFALSQFNGPDYLGAWNRLAPLSVRVKGVSQ